LQEQEKVKVMNLGLKKHLKMDWHLLMVRQRGIN